MVRDTSDFRNLPLLVSYIQDKAPHVKIHLLLWQISLKRVTELKQHFTFTLPLFVDSRETKSSDTPTVFETITLQGTMEKEDLTELCSMLLTKTQAISFLSCQVDFKRINISENLEAIKSL